MNLKSLNQFNRAEIKASDGHIGNVEDFYLDDDFWIVRYLVADTGGWLKDRIVLLPPDVFSGEPDDKEFPVKLSREEVKSSPGLEKYSPVSRQYEKKLADHYNYAPYWRVAASSHGIAGIPPDIPPGRKNDPEEHDPNLRSFNEITNYQLFGLKESAGTVIDMLADEKWNIRYLVVETDQGNKLLPTEMIDRVSFEKSLVITNVEAAKVKNSPDFENINAASSEYEDRIKKHYNV